MSCTAGRRLRWREGRDCDSDARPRVERDQLRCKENSRPNPSPRALLHHYLLVMYAAHRRPNPFGVQHRDSALLGDVSGYPDSTWDTGAIAARREAKDTEREVITFEQINPPPGLHIAHGGYIRALVASAQAYRSLAYALRSHNIDAANPAFADLSTAGGAQLSVWRLAVLGACRKAHLRPAHWITGVGI